MSEDLKSKYPGAFKAMLSHYKNITEPDSLINILQERTRHYWPDSDVNSELFRARFPDTRMLLQMAKLASRRQIKYWHPWHMEVTHKAYRLERNIDWFTPPTGDNEWIDSLVRFTHMIDLAAAYELTRRKKYLRSFECYLNSFSETRTKPGRHWKFLVNSAVRVINLIRAYDLISRINGLALSLHMSIFENVIADVRFLLSSLNEARGNGAFFAATALLIASEYFGDIFHVSDWQTRSENKLRESINIDLQSDWIEAEQVPMYHGQVVLALLDYCVVLIANGRTISVSLRATIKRMLDSLYGLCDPEGMIPPIGDSDRFSIAYIIDFHDTVFTTQYKYNPVNAAACEGYKQCELTTLAATGWVVARWDYGRKARGYLLFDCSGKPGGGMGAHSHADDLQFLLHTRRGPLFTDPGRFTYCADFKAYFPFTRRRIYPKGRFRSLYPLLFPEIEGLFSRNWKYYFRRTLSHNTISRDGRNQPGYADHMEAGARVGLLKHRAIGPLVLLKGYLDTCGRRGEKREPGTDLRSGYKHQRTILGFLPDLWIVVDQLEAEQEHDWISSYHLDAGAEVSIRAHQLCLKAKGDVHHMQCLSSTGSEHTLSIEDDWVSHVYNKKRPSKTIRATIYEASQAVLVTVIHSHTNDAIRIEEGEVIRVAGTGGLTEDIYHFRLISGDYVTRLIVNPECKSLKYDGLEFNGILSMESRIGKHLREAGFLGGTFLASGDYSLTCSARKAGVFRSFDRQG